MLPGGSRESTPVTSQAQQGHFWTLLEKQPTFCFLDGTSMWGQLWNPSVPTSGKLMKVGTQTEDKTPLPHRVMFFPLQLKTGLLYEACWVSML